MHTNTMIHSFPNRTVFCISLLFVHTTQPYRLFDILIILILYFGIKIKVENNKIKYITPQELAEHVK